MLNESVKPVSVLTEEELKKLEREFWVDTDFGSGHFPSLEYLFVSHRTLQERNVKLVRENDELMAENIMRKRYEGFLKSIISSGESLNENDDFETFTTKIKAWEDRP